MVSHCPYKSLRSVIIFLPGQPASRSLRLTDGLAANRLAEHQPCFTILLRAPTENQIFDVNVHCSADLMPETGRVVEFDLT